MANETTFLQTIAGFLGNVFEWYDFGIYGFFSDTIAQVFFPPTTNTNNNNLMYSYIIFGGAFLMRPLGGLIAGHIGDTHGRKRALVFSLFSMTIPTVVMGLLPTYQQVGYWSPVLLTICRLLQGFSVGGQLPSSLVYTLETKPKEHWGYYGSIFSISNGIGSVMANLVGALLRTLLTEEQIVQFGWRVAFLTGILIAPVAVLLHAYGEESSINDVDLNVQEGGRSQVMTQHVNSTISSSSHQSRPLAEALQRKNWLALLSTFLTPMLAGAGYYVTFVWMAIYMKTLIDPPVAGAFWVNLLATIFGYTVPSITAGVLSDRYGRSKIMTLGAVCVGIVAPFMVWIISWGVTWKAFLAQWAIGVLLSIFTGPMWAWLPEKFPPRVRLTSAALGYNFGMCISAGFSPAVATALVHGYGPVAPAILYPFFSVVALIGLFVSTKVHLEGVATDDIIITTQQQDGMDDDYVDNSSTHLI